MIKQHFPQSQVGTSTAALAYMHHACPPSAMHVVSFPFLTVVTCACLSSQFLVVSHKDGFFNNANIIFRTKFVDGVSAVTRTVVAHADRVASGAVHGEELRGGKAAAAGVGAGKPRQALKEANR